MKLAYSHLNLKFNPFGELSIEQRKQVAVVNLDLAKNVLAETILEKNRIALQFLADHGRGKTTHLLSLHECFPHFEYIKLLPGDLPAFRYQALRFVDSVENLPGKRREKLFNMSGAIAFTSHTDLSHELSAAGFKVINQHISLNDESVLKQVFNLRIEYSRRSSGAIPVIDSAMIRNLKARYGDDIRSMEYHLYEVFQTLQRIEHVKM